ncbi:MAG: hypothetical protein K0S39_5562 [Paenibacillus sp.]|jgi:hypothetical protein|nr:hypothetical protein [Paenibacillus sp.]
MVLAAFLLILIVGVIGIFAWKSFMNTQMFVAFKADDNRSREPYRKIKEAVNIEAAQEFHPLEEKIINHKVKPHINSQDIQVTHDGNKREFHREVPSESHLSLEQQLEKIVMSENRLQLNLFNELNKQIDAVQTSLSQISTHLKLMELLNYMETEFNNQVNQVNQATDLR